MEKFPLEKFRNAVRITTDGNLQSFINKSNAFYPSSKWEFKRGVSIKALSS